MVHFCTIGVGITADGRSCQEKVVGRTAEKILTQFRSLPSHYVRMEQMLSVFASSFGTKLSLLAASGSEITQLGHPLKMKRQRETGSKFSFRAV